MFLSINSLKNTLLFLQLSTKILIRNFNERRSILAMLKRIDHHCIGAANCSLCSAPMEGSCCTINNYIIFISNLLLFYIFYFINVCTRF